ncbi:MAG: LysR family transcriptional regulator [Lachnospiraceae bacterium]|nr:LysR family transcriptional regulator [Lachnospiraceae bacterium]
MDIKQLQYFVTSTDCGSFKKAADLLYTSQPHISKCIKALEDELQVELLRRKARGVELTEAGKTVYYTARQMLKDAEKITSIQTLQNKQFLRIGCQTSDFLIHSITDYIQNQPLDDMTIRYIEGDISTLMTELNHRHIDLAFASVSHAMLPAFHQKLESRHLAFYPLFQKKTQLLAGPSNPFYNCNSVTEKDLKSLHFIQFEEDTDFFRKNSSVPLLSNEPFGQLDYPVCTNSRQLIISLLLNTDYCLLTGNIHPELFGDTRIRSIPVESTKIKYTFGYIQNSRESLSPSAQNLLQHVKQLIFKG